MKRITSFTVLALSLGLTSSCEHLKNLDLSALTQNQVSEGMIANALKQALQKGTSSAVTSLSQSGGYGKSALRIALPKELEKVTSTLRKFGMGSFVDSFEDKLNSAAELASAEAKPVFIQAISSMTLADAKGILHGGPTSATDYFKKSTNQSLRERYRPIVQTSLAKLEVMQDYNNLVTRYEALPLTKKVNLRLEDYVVERALDGLYTSISKVETDIRANPVQRTTELMKQVFKLQDK